MPGYRFVAVARSINSSVSSGCWLDSSDPHLDVCTRLQSFIPNLPMMLMGVSVVLLSDGLGSLVGNVGFLVGSELQ